MSLKSTIEIKDILFNYKFFIGMAYENNYVFNTRKDIFLTYISMLSQRYQYAVHLKINFQICFICDIVLIIQNLYHNMTKEANKLLSNYTQYFISHTSIK